MQAGNEDFRDQLGRGGLRDGEPEVRDRCEIRSGNDREPIRGPTVRRSLHFVSDSSVVFAFPLYGIFTPRTS